MNAERERGININLDSNNKLTVQMKGLILPEFIQLCLAAIGSACKQSLARAAESDPEGELVKALEEDMYEMINVGASSLLSKTFPNIEMRPDLTVDAIQKAEDDLINNKNKLQEYQDAYEDSAQSKKDVYEHNMVKANLVAQEMNREQRRKAKIKNPNK